MLQNVARERFKIGEAGLAHERGVGGHAFDKGICVQLQHSRFVRTVGEKFYFQIF